MAAFSDTPDGARHRALEILKRFGWNATSFQTLEPGFQYWFSGDGYVAFVDTGSAWVVAGAPIGAVVCLAEIAQRFTSAAAERKRRVCFFGIEQRFLDAVPLAPIPIGEQPVWDPQAWDQTVRSSRSLRDQLRRARSKGVRVHALSSATAADPTGRYRPALDHLIHRWLAAKPMAPMGFLVQVDPFAFPAERRYYVAERNGEVLGFLALVPIYARNGWFLEDLLRDEASPNGTADLLIDAAMRGLAEDGSTYATLGLAALSGTVSGRLQRIRRWSTALYNFQGLRAFRERLRPSLWEPIYLARPSEQSEVLTLYDVLVAFARGGLLRFGLETLLRVPEVGIRVLATLLVPWIILLASAETERWFAARWIQQGWVVFDLALLFGLWMLCLRWRQRLAIVLATLISADAILTAIQVGTFNIHRATGPLDWAVFAVAILAPLATALLLWAAVRHGSHGHK